MVLALVSHSFLPDVTSRLLDAFWNSTYMTFKETNKFVF